jgi:adenosylhomocysteine nucleosidase
MTSAAGEHGEHSERSERSERSEPRVLILAPMRMELRPVARALRSERVVVGDEHLHRARVGRAEVAAAVIGVGPAAAARSTARLLDAWPADFVLVSGIAGGLDPALTIGTVIVPATVVDRSSGKRFHPTPLSNVVASGTIATSDELILDDERLGHLTSDGVIAVDMETAAVAEVCSERGCAWSAFRAISDRPTDGLVDDTVFSMLKPDGRADGWAAARFVVTHPWRVPRLVRLGRDSTLAARRAADAAVAAAAQL